MASPKKGAKKAVAKKSPVKGGKVKKVKDPNAPKRNMSAYMIWLQQNRDSIKKPGDGVADVAKRAGVEWGKMSGSDKTKWEKLAGEAKKKYEKEMAAYKKK